MAGAAAPAAGWVGTSAWPVRLYLQWMSDPTEFEAEAYLPAPVRGPVVLVLFGGAGALARAKLLPAVYNLAHDKLLPKGFSTTMPMVGSACPQRARPASARPRIMDS